MGQNPPRSTSWRGGLFAGLLLFINGCATGFAPAELSSMLHPIQSAASDDPALVRAKAEQGDAQAQLALWLILSHGLGGVRSSPEEAALWRAQALRARGYMPITQYTAAFNGQPSRINILNIPRYDVPPAQVMQIERCVAFLSEGTGAPGACGNAGDTERLNAIWRQSRAF